MEKIAKEGLPSPDKKGGKEDLVFTVHRITNPSVVT